MAQEMIAEDQVGHGLNDGYCARKDTGVMTAAAFEFRVFEAL